MNRPLVEGGIRESYFFPQTESLFTEVHRRRQNAPLFHRLVWEPRSEIRAKTVKTRVLGSSLSSSLPSSAILVSERSHKIFQIFVHIYADFFPPVKLMNSI